MLGPIARVRRLAKATRPFVGALRKVFGDETGKDLVRRLADARSDAERMQAIAEWMFTLQYEDVVDRAAEATVGLADDFLEVDALAGHLVEVPHMGVLVAPFEPGATRLDYVYLVCDALLALRQTHVGLGLGSPVKKDKAVWPDKRPTKLEVAQAWAVLLNSGHLFGTFATERAVLFRVGTEPEVADAILDGIDPALRQTCADLVASGVLRRFHYVLAALRVSDLPDSAVRKRAVECLRLFFECLSDSDAEPRLMWAFRRSRQIAYNRMHALLRVGLSLEGAQYGRLVELIARRDGILPVSGHWQETRAVDLLNALDRYHEEAFFSGPLAAGHVLDHLQEFNSWWDRRPAGEDTLTRLRQLYREPESWPEVARPLDFHLLRFRFARPTQQWVEEVVAWRGADPWDRQNFLVTPDIDGNHLLVDVYSGTPGVDWAVLRQITERLSVVVQWTWSGPPDAASWPAWRSAAAWGLWLLDRELRPGFNLSLTPSAAADSHVGYGLVSRTAGEAAARVVQLERNVLSSGRKDEFKGVVSCLRSQDEEENAYWIVLLGAVRVLDAETQSERAEIDGAWCRVGASTLRWTFFERKGGSGSGSSQLSRLSKLFGGAFSDEVCSERARGGKNYWVHMASCTQ